LGVSYGGGLNADVLDESFTISLPWVKFGTVTHRLWKQKKIVAT
jgi:hypothetical protein